MDQDIRSSASGSAFLVIFMAKSRTISFIIDGQDNLSRVLAQAQKNLNDELMHWPTQHHIDDKTIIAIERR